MLTYARIYETADIYPKNWVPVAPAGYKITGFRVPVAGEEYLNSINPNLRMPGLNHRGPEPRLIVEKVKRKVYTFTATGEQRIPKKGEWINALRYYRGSEGRQPYFYPCEIDDCTASHDIYELVVTEV